MKKKKWTFLGFIIASALGLSMALSQAILADDKELPPGIAKQETIPGKGRHKGWEKGKHKGWEKKKSEGGTKKAEKNLEKKTDKGKEEKAQ